MVFHIDLDDDVEKELRETAERSGETIDQVATRLLRDALSPDAQSLAPFRVQSFALDIPEKWQGMTPSQIDYELEMEHYMEKEERAKRESGVVSP